MELELPGESSAMLIEVNLPPGDPPPSSSNGGGPGGGGAFNQRVDDVKANIPGLGRQKMRQNKKRR